MQSVAKKKKKFLFSGDADGKQKRPKHVFVWEKNFFFHWSGQVRVFNVHIQSKLLYRTSVTGTGTGLRRFLCPGQEKKKKGGGGGRSKGGTACTGGYKGVQAVRSESVAGGGWYEMLWNLECLIELSQREICAHFNEGNLTQFGRSAEK